MLGQQAAQRGRARDDFLPQGRCGGFEIREALAALGVFPRRPAGQRFPGGGQVALLDGGRAETHHRVARPAQVGPCAGLVVGEVLAGLCRGRQVPALGPRGFAGLGQGLVGPGDRGERADDLGLRGRRGERRRHVAEVLAGKVHGSLGRRHELAGLVTGRTHPGELLLGGVDRGPDLVQPWRRRMAGQRVNRLQADRAGFAGPQALGQGIGGVGLMRRVPGGAGLPGLLLRRLEIQDEHVVRIPLGGQILLLRLQPGGEGALLLISARERLHVSLFRQRAAGPFGLILGLSRVVGLLRAGRDPLVGGGDPVGQARHAGRHADGRQQPGLGAHGVGLLGRLAGLLGPLAEGTQPVIDGLPERAQVPDAGRGLFLGFRRGVGELGPLVQRQPRPFGRQPGPVPGLLPDLLVDAEREQFDEQLLALARFAWRKSANRPCGSSTDWMKWS